MRRVDRLLELQKIDLALDAARKRMRAIDAQLAESDELRAARQADQEHHDRLTELRARSKDLELQSTALDDKIRAVDDRLYSGAVKNPKELNDLQMDAAALRRQKSSLDDTLLQVILETEEAERASKAAHTERARIEAAWHNNQAELIEERAGLNQYILSSEAERKAKRAGIAPADQVIYDQLRAKKHGQVVALLEDDICSACGVQVSANKLARLQRQDELLPCGNCERILIDAR